MTNTLTVGQLKKIMRESLGLTETAVQEVVSEALVAQPKQFDLPTEFLSLKTKEAHLQSYQQHVAQFNKVSAALDTASLAEANDLSSAFRALKVDEVHNLNSVFLHELYFANISDVQSEITMSMLCFMRLARDFGTFEDWQKNFIACAMSARSGWAVTGFHTYLQRYVNFFVDGHDGHIPMGVHPVIVLDMWEHAYQRDYMGEKMTYVHAMMKELDWEVIEDRFKRADQLAAALRR